MLNVIDSAIVQLTSLKIQIKSIKYIYLYKK
jgi:hypothetical protein